MLRKLLVREVEIHEIRILDPSRLIVGDDFEWAAAH
jgi:hypothetical protein